MRIFKNILTKLFIAVLIVTNVPVAAFGVGSSPVQFTIPDTSMTINGFAAPNALVSIYDSNSLIGTVVASKQGTFSKTFGAQTVGLHNIKLSYIDKFGIVSDSVSDNVSIKVQEDTALEYFLPPTIRIIPKSLTEGGLVSFRGSTIPGARVELSIDGGNKLLRPLAGPDGTYNASFSTTGFYFGNHPVVATASSNTLTSFQTNEKLFEVLPSPIEEQIKTNIEGVIDPPIITKPSSPHTSEDDQILIQGTGPANTQVIVYVDGIPVGSTFTNSEGFWFFNINITDVLHAVTTAACIGNVCSQLSNTLELTFAGDFNKCANFSFLLEEYRFFGINPDDGVDLEFKDLSGVPGYEMVVDWGDTYVEKFNHTDQDGFKIHHVFKDEGQFNGVVTIQDNRGCSITRYFSVNVLSVEFNSSTLFWIIPIFLGGGLLFTFRETERQRYQRLLAIQENYKDDLDDFKPGKHTTT